MRFWSVIVVVMFGFGLLLYAVVTMPHNHEMTYDSYLSIVLASLAVMLTALAIIVGIAAVWGYQQISEKAESRAEAAAIKKVESLLADTNIKNTLKGMVDAKIAEEGDALFDDMNLTGAAPVPRAEEQPDENQRAADPYPEDQG